MATQDLDFRGLKCPMPVMKLAVAAKKAAAGDVFSLTVDDAGFEADIKAWCKETGNELKDLKKEGKDIIATVVKK